MGKRALNIGGTAQDMAFRCRGRIGCEARLLSRGNLRLWENEFSLARIGTVRATEGVESSFPMGQAARLEDRAASTLALFATRQVCRASNG